MKIKLTLLMLSLFSMSVFSQNDCKDALIVCGNMGYEGLTATGFGIQELLNTNNCGSFESNSIWLQLPINTGGTLGFTITPGNTDIDVDFDFFVYGPNATCDNIGMAVRCSTTNPEAALSNTNQTGMNDSETDTSEGPGEFGNNFVQWLTVQDGEIYFLVIDRPVGDSDFSIEWTGTATFHPSPVFNNPQSISLDLSQCDSDAIDDKSSAFDLTTHAAMLLGTQPVTLTYHKNSNDVLTGASPIPNPESFANEINPQIVFMRMTNNVTGCFETLSFNISIINPVVAGDPNDLSLCDLDESGVQQFNLAQNEPLIKNGNNNAAVTYYASLQDAENEVNPLPVLYQNPTPYIVNTVWARLENTSGCFGYDITSFSLTITPLPDIVYSLKIKDLTNSNNTVTVVMNDVENYLFSIDGKNFTDNTIFTKLQPGPHTIYIKARNGCKTISEDIVILDYPKFFTPNGDGENETWRIPYLNLQPQAEITIFDRYGKLITGFKGSSPGWDGTLNNEKLPSTDYWFVLQLDTGRIIRGHFAMVR